MLSPVVVYIFLGCILLTVAFILGIVWDIQMDLCTIMAHTERTYDLLLRWVIYYVKLEYKNGNNEPFDYIFPNDREEMEKDMENADK